MMALPDLVSPRQEMLAYETLWSFRNQSLKSLAGLFTQRAGFPSQILEWVKAFGIIPIPPEDQLLTVEKYVQNLAGFSVCVNGTELYPEQLRRARHPIELFYYKGDIELCRKPSISVVGARKCSATGAQRAQRLSRELVKSGFVIVSGLAEGIDTAAMTAAIDAGGQVIGVIGTPITECYPKNNLELQAKVARDHLLVSQVPFYRYWTEPFTSKRRYFPERNETMAALSQATVIVEASEKSGTHSQARACLMKKKPLFILHSCFGNPNITWPEKYLQQGAIRIRETKEILDRLPAASHEPDFLD